MKNFRSVFSLLLVVFLVCGMLPMQAAAQEATEEYMTLEDAVAYVRQELSVFNPLFSFKFFFDDPNYYTDDQIIELFLAEVLKHTGVPDQGDYMKWTFQQWGYLVEATFDGTTHYVSVTDFSPTYNNTPEQESELEQKLDQVFQSLNLDGKSDYEKIKTIYEYVCKNAAFSEEVMLSEANPLLPPNELKIYYSAYGALVLGSTTCQGFSSLLYRMLLQAGIDCRLIVGDDHGWNIVRLDGKYYYLDPTYDSDNLHFGSDLERFLKGSASFRTGGTFDGSTASSHEYKTVIEQFTADFLDQYPISVWDCGQEDLLTGNPDDVLGSGQCGSQANWVLTGDGKLTISGTGSIWNAPGGTFWNSRDERWNGLNGYITQVEIQEGITAIGDYAFMNCPRLTQVSIADSVKSIGEYAFGLCENLAQITLPDSVKTLGYRAFYQCVRMEHANLSASMKEVTEGAFVGCTSLKTVHIPDGIQKIGSVAFANCHSLQEIAFPASVTTLEDSAFYGSFDPEAKVTLNIPETVKQVQEGCFKKSGLYAVKLHAPIKKLEPRVFQFCHTLQSVELPDTIQSFTEDAFWGCSNLRRVKLPAALKDLGLNAFVDCEALQAVDFPATLHLIPSITFVRCSSLEELVIPATIEEIESGAFSSCDGLKKVIISDGLGKLGGYAFSDCTSLKEIIFEGDAPEIGTNPFAFLEQLVIYYPMESGTWTQSHVEQLVSGGFISCCGYTGSIYDHNIEWRTDENSHWLCCTDCDDISMEAFGMHIIEENTLIEEGICRVCGCVKSPEHNFHWVLVPAYHSYECMDCGFIYMQAEHRYDNNICLDCGYDPSTVAPTEETQGRRPQNNSTQPTEAESIPESQPKAMYLWIIPGVAVAAAAVFLGILLKKKNAK